MLAREDKIENSNRDGFEFPREIYRRIIRSYNANARRAFRGGADAGESEISSRLSEKRLVKPGKCEVARRLNYPRDHAGGCSPEARIAVGRTPRVSATSDTPGVI